MKKIKILIILFLMIIPTMTFAEEEYTITYDANDGTDRKEVVTTNDITNVEMPGVQYFDGMGDEFDPLDDKIISSWNTQPNQSLNSGSATRMKPFKTFDLSSYVDDSNNVTIYAEWIGRVEKTPRQERVTGDNVRVENLQYVIEPYTNFTIEFTRFERTFREQLLYYRLPDFLKSVLPDFLEDTLANKYSFDVRVNSAGDYYTYHGGKFYIRDNILVIDLINDNTLEYTTMNNIISVFIDIKLNFEYRQVENNNHFLYSATVTGQANNNSPITYPEVFQTGKITVKYIDIDTEEELTDDIITKDTIGEIYQIDQKEFEEYELVESPDDNPTYEEQEQILYLKYKKEEIKEEPEEPNIIDEIINPYTKRSLLLFLCVLIPIIGIFYIRKRSKV